MKFKLIIITAAVFFIITVIILFYLHSTNKKEFIKVFQTEQLVATRQLVKEIESYLHDRAQGVNILSYFPSLQNRDMKKMEAEIQSFFDNEKKNHVKAVSVYDEKGTIIYSTTKDAIGRSYAECDFFAWAIKKENKGKQFISSLIQITDNQTAPLPYFRFLIAAPIYQEVKNTRSQKSTYKFVGIVTSTIDIEEVISAFLPIVSPDANQEHTYTYIMDRNGTVLFHGKHPEMALRNIRSQNKTCVQCHTSFDHVKTILSAKEGAVKYALKEKPKTLASFSSAEFMNISWKIVVNTNYDEITGVINRNLFMFLILIGIITLTFIGGYYLIYSSNQLKNQWQKEAKQWREKRELEDKILESEEHYRTIVDISLNAIIIYCEGYIVFVNPAAVKLVGASSQNNLLGKPAIEFVHPDERESISKRILKILKSGKSSSWLKERFIRMDGSTIYVETIGTPTTYNGKPAVQVIVHDITERKRAEQQIRESEKKLRVLVEGTKALLFTTDHQGRFTYINLEGSELLGIPTNQLLGSFYLRLVHPDDRKRVHQQYLHQLEHTIESTYLEFRYIRKNDKIGWFSFFVNPIVKSGKIVGLSGVAQDITERKRSEETLKESEKRYYDIFKYAPVGIYQSNLDDRFITANDRLAEILGYDSTDELLRQRISKDIYYNAQERAKLIAKFEPIGLAFNHEVLWKKKNGDPIRISLTAHAVKDESKNVLYFEGFVEDITERKRSEETLKQSELKYKQLFNDDLTGDFIISVDGTIELCNPAMAKIFGCDSVDEMMKLNISEFYRSPGEREKLLDLVREKKKVEEYEQVHITHDGRVISTIENVVGEFDENGELVRLKGSLFDDTEHKRSEQEIISQKNRFVQLFENSPIAIALLDDQDKIIHINESFSALFGYYLEEIKDQSLNDIIVLPELKEEAKSYSDQTHAGNQINKESYRKRKDGNLIYVQIVGVPITVNGKTVGIYGMYVDLTQRKKADEELKKSREELLKFFENDISADFISTSDGKLLLCNRTFLKLFGFTSKEEAFKYQIEKLYRDSSDRKIFLDMLKTNKKIEDFEVEFISLDGRIIYALINATGEFDEAGELIQLRGYIFDITERKKAEEGLRKLSRAIEQGPASVIITNQDGDIEYVNEKFCAVTGYSNEEMIGKNPRILKSGRHDKNFYADLWNHILSGKDWKGEMLNKKKNGELFWESVLISPLVNNEGDITNFVAVKEDITEKKKMINDLIKSKELADNANKLKDTFISNMSHEIRTPLNGILGMTSLLKELYAAQITDEAEEYFMGIDKSSQRLIRTVDMILSYSRLQTGEFPINPIQMELYSICENLVKEFINAAKSKLLKLSFKNRCSKTAAIFGDEYSITQAISNLIDNAIKYTNKGFIDVILYKGNDDEIMLDIKDSGIGISEDYIQHIYEPYTQEQIGYGRSYEGIGLGLPIVKKFLGLNNAKISAESKKEKGTTFTINFGKSIHLPEEKITEEKIIKNVTSQERKNKPLVLIIEDDEFNQITIKGFIKGSYNTISSDSFEGAIELLKDNKVDMILMDISLKGSMDGLELTKELKASKEYSHIPVVAITAHAFDKDRQNALEAGCNDYLAKPFSKNLLLHKIGKFV